MTLATFPGEPVPAVRFAIEPRRVGPSTWVYRIVDGVGTVRQSCNDPHIAIVACDALNQEW